MKHQRPATGSREERDLTTIYGMFHGAKHDFESLAAEVAARVIRGRGTEYRQGWLTRPSQDGGTDFVGRLDIGEGNAVTKLVVLGQAKCVLPDSSISADQVARVVARLQRGWIGVYVTTGAFSEAAQLEIVEDRYPIILINGKTMASHLRQIADTTTGGDLEKCIRQIVGSTSSTVLNRRPEEILLI